MGEAGEKFGSGVISQIIVDDGLFPNNARVPLVVVRRDAAGMDSAATGARLAGEFESKFGANSWLPAWRSGIFDFHHYHSTAHEALGCYQGHATLQFGGEQGVQFDVGAGDIVIIPAGVAHRCVIAEQFSCVGAYPVRQSWDTCYGKAGERPAADERIARVLMAESDPLGLGINLG